MQVLRFIRETDGLKINIEGNEVDLGGELYPFEGKGHVHYWENEREPRDSNLSDVLFWIDQVNREQFDKDRCCWNAEIIRTIGRRLGVDLKLFSGWIVIDDRIAVYHAWNVLNDSILLDATITRTKADLIARFEKHIQDHPGSTNPEERERLIRLYADVERSRRRMSESMVVGLIPEGVRYFGKEHTYQGARESIARLIEAHPNHPGNPNRRNRNGQTILQEMLRMKGIY